MRETTLSQMAIARYREGGDAVRYHFPSGDVWRSMSWTEGLTAAKEIALGLRSLGISPGDRVAILSGTRVEWALCDLACMCAGFPSVPVYPTNTSEQVEYILAHSEARVIFVEDGVQAEKVLSRKAGLSALGPLIRIDGEPGTGGVSDLASLREAGRAWEAKNQGEFDRLADAIKPNDLFSIIYTSGTTGPPKGSEVLHRNFVANSAALREVIPLVRGEVFLHFLPLSHVLARLEHMVSIDSGMVSGFARSPQTVLDDMSIVKPHVMVSVPRLYEKIFAGVVAKVESRPPLRRKIFHWAVKVGKESSRKIQKKEPLGFPLSLYRAIADTLVYKTIRERLGGRLRFFVSGGAPLSSEVGEFFHALGVKIIEGYGMTETPTCISVNHVDKFRFGTVGFPMPGTEVKLAEDGEILFRGPNLFRGYYRDPEATAAAMTPDGFLKTGDIGAFDADGFLRITDRKKDIIVTSGGKNIAPQNIEVMLKGDPFVSQALVFGDRKKFITALITLNPEEVVRWAMGYGIAETDMEKLSVDYRIIEKVRSIVDGVNRGLAPYEQVKKFVVLPADFTQESGELTPTLKVKRKVVVERHGHKLEALYEKE